MSESNEPPPPPPAAEHHQLPKGGPIFLQGFSGPLTSVPKFETSVVEELQSLINQVNLDQGEQSLSSLLFGDDDDDDEDVFVDELKVFSEEELVARALEQVQTQPPTQNEIPPQEDVPEDEVKKANKKKKKKKRGRAFDRDMRAAELDNPTFIENIEKIAKIKRKQDEDKKGARLHSCNSGCMVSKGSVTTDTKMTSLRYVTSGARVVKSGNAVEHVGISYPEVLLCVEVFKLSKDWVKTQEVLVLGSQMLSELRDCIYCVTDKLMKKAGRHDPSGYFLIEDMFCNDRRDHSSIDYSEPIFKWLTHSKEEASKKWECIISGDSKQKYKEYRERTSPPDLPRFEAYEMHKVRFCDLSFRLGTGYLYCHQGDCKHIIVIRDMRLIHPEDVQNRAAYPLLAFQLKTRHTKCSVCNIYRATKVTVDDKYAGENPCYFCDICYHFLHYKEDNTLLYDDFSVYDYHRE